MRSRRAAAKAASARPRETARRATDGAELLPRRLAWILVAALGATFGLHRLIDPDVFQQIAVGRAILADPGSLGISDFIDDYPAFPYVEDKWLPSVVAALIERAGGSDGLMLYQIAICVLVAAAWYAMQRAWGASRAVAVVGVALALLTCGFRLEPRPDTLSHAFLAVAMALVVMPVPRRRALWLVPLVMALWVNVHGYFVNGLLVLLAAAVAAALGDRTPGVRAANRDALGPRDRFLVLALAIAACLLHPQGWHALASPVMQILQVGDPAYRDAIQELQPSAQLFAGAGSAHWLVLVGPLLLALAIAWTARGRSVVRRQGLAMVAAVPWLLWPPPALDALEYRLIVALLVMAIVEVPVAIERGWWLGPLLLGGFTVLAAAVVRNTPLVTPVALVMLAPAWTELGTVLLRARPALATRRVAFACLLAFVVAVGWLRLSDRMNTVVRAPSRTGWGIETARFPVGAADFIAAGDLPDRLLNTFDVGGYLLYRLHPERRVFIAGNSAQYPPEFFQYYLRHVTGWELNLDALARERGIRTIIVDLATPVTALLINRLMTSPAWSLVFLDHAAAVYAETGAAPPIVLEARVAELLREEHFHPGLPVWLGGRPLTYPSANLPAFLQTIGRPDLALAAADQIWPHAPSQALAVLAGTAAIQSSRIAGRVPWLEDALARYPASVDLRKLLFFALAYESDDLIARRALPEAERRLARMRELQPDACGPFTALAKVAVLGGDPVRARAMLEESARRDRDGACRRQAEADPALRAIAAR